MSYYKVQYNIDTFKSPHCRYYHAKNASTALNMFEETQTHELKGYETKVLTVKEVQEKDGKLVECVDNKCCNSNCQ